MEEREIQGCRVSVAKRLFAALALGSSLGLTTYCLCDYDKMTEFLGASVSSSVLLILRVPKVTERFSQGHAHTVLSRVAGIN